MDYDRLLNDWAEEMYSRIEARKSTNDKSRITKSEEHYLLGYENGIIEAIAWLSYLEKRKSLDYEMDE